MSVGDLVRCTHAGHLDEDKIGVITGIIQHPSTGAGYICHVLFAGHEVAWPIALENLEVLNESR